MSVRGFAFYCICGAAMTGSVSPGRNAEELERIFRSLHNGEGHGPTDRRVAATARRRSERTAEAHL